jgi:hypothetical protein
MAALRPTEFFPYVYSVTGPNGEHVWLGSKCYHVPLALMLEVYLRNSWKVQYCPSQKLDLHEDGKVVGSDSIFRAPAYDVNHMDNDQSQSSPRWAGENTAILLVYYNCKSSHGEQATVPVLAERRLMEDQDNLGLFYVYNNFHQ